MNQVRITKSFTFDMAHALEGHDGLCKNIHGHTYFLRITIKGIVKDELGHPKNGFVYDFKDLKDLVKDRILDIFDHSLVVHDKSELFINGSLHSFTDRIVATNYQPTCENLLLDFVQRVQSKLPHTIQLVAVRLDETPTSYAEWLSIDQTH